MVGEVKGFLKNRNVLSAFKMADTYPDTVNYQAINDLALIILIKGSVRPIALFLSFLGMSFHDRYLGS